jgi:hypothetical protein
MEPPVSPTAVRAADVPPRLKATNYPEPFAARVAGRQKRVLGDLFGLSNFGVNLTRLRPGAMSSLRHAHSKQDEFMELCHTVNRQDQEVAVITTYERDSIWQVQRQVLKYSDLAIELPARRIKFGGKTYRYQLVSNAEPVRLLNNPLGTIPIHRISHPRTGDDGLWEVLLHDLSIVGEAELCAARDAR